MFCLWVNILALPKWYDNVIKSKKKKKDEFHKIG